MSCICRSTHRATPSQLFIQISHTAAAAAAGQRASGGAANGATVVDESVRQLKGAGQVVTEHWRTMPEITGRVMTLPNYSYD
jgi:hypothetical protein